MTVLMFGADVIKAPGCPHYVLRSEYEIWHATIAPKTSRKMLCQRCLLSPVRQFGQPIKSGPTTASQEVEPWWRAA